MLEKGISPNATAYNSLLKQHCIRKDMRSAMELYRGMCFHGVLPNSDTYNILIKGHSKARNMKEACYLNSEMVEKGFKLSGSSYNALIKGLSKRKKMDGSVADKEIYDNFIDLNYSEGNMESVLELCDEAIEKRLVNKMGNEIIKK